jgi:hypothetical protein
VLRTSIRHIHVDLHSYNGTTISARRLSGATNLRHNKLL